MFKNTCSEEINLGLKIYIKVSNFAMKVNFSIFQKDWKHTLYPLYTVPVFTVEFGFTMW